MSNNLVTVFVFSFFIAVSVYGEQNSVYKSYTDIEPLEKSDLTISDVVFEPNKYHREVITVDGRVSDLKYKRLINGRKFTLFKLNGESDKALKVYARGFIDEIKDGSELRIYGRYSKKKRFLFKKYKNVMKAKKIFILNS